MNVMLVLFASITQACDACGCATGGMGFGYVPFQNSHFVGLNYQYNQFTTLHPALFSEDDDTESVDKFNTATIWGRFFVSDRVVVAGYIPLKYNTVLGDGHDNGLNGLGDIRVQGLYALIKKGNAMSDKQANWFLGGSLVLPTGKVDAETESSLPNLQLGTGALGAEINSNLSIRRYALGFSYEVTAKTNGANANDYRVGNELNSTLVAFYRIKKERLSLIPQVGLSQLHRAQDYKNASTQLQNEFSGVQLISATAGLGIYTSKLGARLNYQLPLASNISNGYTKPSNLLNFQFLYLVNFKKQQNE